MAVTIKLVDKNGTLAIMDDEFGKVGTGRAKPSSQLGYITLTLKFRHPNIKKKKFYVDDFLVMRVPIDWTQAGDL